MKRTFGKILSFALVLAMVLSMVPAVLAAPKVGDAQYLALGETANLTCTGAKFWIFIQSKRRQRDKDGDWQGNDHGSVDHQQRLGLRHSNDLCV